MKNPKVSMHHGAKPSTFGNAKYLRYVAATKQETILWDRLKNKQVLNQKFRRQHPLASYVLDFYCDYCKISIEIDGDHHDEKAQKEYDANRSEYLNSVGIFELRFNNKNIDNDLEWVMEEIKKLILSRINE
jgi:very-short-patch-repair endonuclease